jgi:hypothetical protein
MSTTQGDVMIRKRIPKLFFIAAVAFFFGLGVMVAPTVMPTLTPMMMPVANADVLPNGYDVNCKKSSDTQVVCTYSGCPRVHEDLAGDVVHTKISGGPQSELRKACGNTTTETINATGAFDVGIQGCRKSTFGTDDCGAWSNYKYVPPPVVEAPKPPVKCGPNDEAPEVPAGQTCKPKALVKCPAGATTPEAVSLDKCVIPEVTNAIQASFGDPGLSTLDFNVTNTSSIAARCDYTATANSINPLVPKTTKRTFNVPANGNHTETFSGAPTFTNYNVVLSCVDASGKQKAPLGTVNTSVTW